MAPTNKLVISEVYSAGGNTGATLKNDFIELHNLTGETIDLNGYSVQYASAGGSTWAVTTLTGSIAPYGYYLIQEAFGAGGTTDLPTPDRVGTIPLGAAAGKVALVQGTSPLTSATDRTNVVDFLGYGTANSAEGTPASSISNTNQSYTRINDGNTDTDDNSADFTTQSPSPQNSSSPANPCYCTGTRILTWREVDGAFIEAEVAVEDLAIGDMVVTASGAHRPIRWIGARGYIGRFANANPDLLPICVKAGALADGVPARDLWVSPKHALYLDGVLIPAECLVNGASIVKATRVESLHYWHVELDSHDVLLAEGASAESFVDDDGRAIFHNAHTFHERYPDAWPVPAVYYAERVEGGYGLQAVRRRLAERAGIGTPVRPLGDLRGGIEGCDGLRVWGWAQSSAYPDAPVCLEVLVDGVVVGLVYADRDHGGGAGTGESGHPFAWRLPAPVAPELAHRVAVRRAFDGALLKGAGEIPVRTAA